MLKLRDIGILSVMMILALGGCATMPTGPSVMVLPPPEKPFEQFQADDAVCRNWAAQQIGVSPQEAANRNTASGAILGTIIGAGLGAAIGSASGDVGAGAAIGAASGLFVGAASGANAGQVYGWRAQRRYDISYAQCMYAKGNEVPGMTKRRARRGPPPPDLRSAPPDSESPYAPEPLPEE